MIITFVGNFYVSYTSETHHANTLESLGHTVHRLQEGKAIAEQIFVYAEKSDLLVFIHTHGWQTPGRTTLAQVFDWLKDKGIPTMTYHLDLWFGLDRQKDLESDSFYRTIGHFFTVDKKMADWFNENTSVKGHYLQAGVYEPECYIAEKVQQPPHEIAFVGSRGYHPEWQYRPQLIDWLKETYGQRFAHYGNDGNGVIRGEALNRLYADTKVVVGDTLCLNFDYPYYWSDRVYETMGRGGFIIHPYIKGMEEHFEDGKHLAFYTYGDFDELKEKIDYYLEHDTERETIRMAGFEYIKKNHTYTNRWQTIIKELGL